MQVPLLHVSNSLMPAHRMLNIRRDCLEVQGSREHIRDRRIRKISIHSLARLRDRVRPVAASRAGFPGEVCVVEDSITQSNGCLRSQKISHAEPWRKVAAIAIA